MMAHRFGGLRLGVQVDCDSPDLRQMHGEPLRQHAKALRAHQPASRVVHRRVFIARVFVPLAVDQLLFAEALIAEPSLVVRGGCPSPLAITSP